MAASESEDWLERRRSELERHAAILFLTAALTMMIICGAIIVSGWFAGVMDDRFENTFWAGAILGFLAVLTLGAAAIPGGDNDQFEIRRMRWLTRVGLVAFIVAPCLCLGAMVADFYR